MWGTFMYPLTLSCINKVVDIFEFVIYLTTLWSILGSTFGSDHPPHCTLIH